MTIIRRSKTPARGADGSGAENGRRRPRTESLWAHYRRTRSRRTRDQLVERYRGVVDSAAAAFAARLPRCVDVQDLAHAGMWGLMQAIESFQPERGTHFLPFMRMRVRGAMLDELRALDALPRLARARRRARDEAEGRLRQSLHRDPSDAELAAELGISEETLRRKFCEGPPWGRRIDEDGEGDSLEEIADDQFEDPVEALWRRDLLQKIKGSLQPVEWQVLELHYLEGLPGKEIARRLRLSASRVCQIHVRVLSRLKAKLREAGPLH